MKRNKTFYGIVTAFLLCGSMAFAADSPKVVAQVGDVEITQEQVDQLVNQLPPEQAAFFKTPAGQEKVVDELVSRELLFLWGEAQNVDEQEGFAEDLARLRGNLVRDYAVKTIIENVSATDEEVQAFYEENIDKFALPEKVRAHPRGKRGRCGEDSRRN